MERTSGRSSPAARSKGRGERVGYMVVGILTCVIVLMAVFIVGMDAWGARRVADCREGLTPGGDEWAMCDERGDLFP